MLGKFGEGRIGFARIVGGKGFLFSNVYLFPYPNDVALCPSAVTLLS